jgi:polyhydroxyalkanoate synthesis regulator phasin
MMVEVYRFHSLSPGEEIPMVDLIKKAFYTGVGLAVLTKEKAEELVKDLADHAKLSEHEGKELVDSLMKQSDQARNDFQSRVDDTVQAVVGRLNLATKDEVASLRAKIDELSAKIGAGQGTGPGAGT